MSDLYRSALSRSIIGAGVALIVGAGLGAPSHAGMVENAQKMMRLGQCITVGGKNPGQICLVRERVGNPQYVHFHFTFSGGLKYFNERQLQSQSEIQLVPGTRRSVTIYRRAKPGQVVQVNVQACEKPTLFIPSTCSPWATLKVMM